MINNKIKYLSVFSTLLLMCNSVSFTMDNEPSKNENKFNFGKGIYTNHVNNKDIVRKENIVDSYVKIQKQLKRLCDIIMIFKDSVQNIMKYSANSNLEEVMDTIQSIYYNFISIDNNATFNDREFAILTKQDIISSYIEFNSKLNNSNNIIDNNNMEDAVLMKLNKLLKIVKSHDIDDIKNFINEQKEKLIIIEKNGNCYNDKLNKKYTNAMSEFIRMCYNYNANNNESPDSNSSINIDKEPNLNVGEIDKTYSTEKRYSEKYQTRLNYGKSAINELIPQMKKYYGYSPQDKISNKLMLKCLLKISQEYDDQIYFSSLQSIFDINDLVKFFGVKTQEDLMEAKKTFDEKRITNLIDKLDEKTIQNSINKLTDRLIETLGDTCIQSDIFQKISDNKDQIIASYKSLVETGTKLINELNVLQKQLNDLLTTKYR